MALAQMPLSFLRPRALPRPSTIKYFFGTSRASSTASTVTPPNPPTPSSKPYRVILSPSNSLPVYHLWKRGGNMHLTKVKHIEGSIEELKADLQKALEAHNDKEVVINELTKSIIIKGHRKAEVIKFLEENKVGFREVMEVL